MDPHIQYWRLTLLAALVAPLWASDPVAALRDKLERGEAKLEFNERYGYLPSVLKLLGVPVSSQMLVFSKTSLQHKHITPQTPRAIYFNDSVYVGYVPDGDLMELSAVDPEQGAMFYTLDQAASPKARPVRRTDDCWQCHATPATMGVPGHMVRSLMTAPDGNPLISTGGFLTDHRSPLRDRWGGWYVTGTSGEEGLHMGNLLVRAADDKARLDLRRGSNVTDLTGRLQLARYPTSHSDLVALMVMEHQARLQNLLALATRDATPKRVEELVRYLLFVDEARLEEPVKGTSSFARDFVKAGPRDKRGRSLRDFDLTARMFRYPCSYLIYSPAFDGLPPDARTAIYTRLRQVLGGGVAGYERLTAEDRRAVAEILTATKPEFARVNPVGAR